MGATNESGEYAWLMQEAEAWAQERAEFKARLDELENEVRNSVKRRDSIEMPGSVKDGPGSKVYVDLADEAQARSLVEAAIRVRQYASDLRSGAAQVPSIPAGGA